jgi:hypothetical protein
MSCAGCVEALSLDRHNEGGEYFFRWKNADLKLVGCEKHVGEAMAALRAAQREGVIARRVPRRPRGERERC